MRRKNRKINQRHHHHQGKGLFRCGRWARKRNRLLLDKVPKQAREDRPNQLYRIVQPSRRRRTENLLAVQNSRSRVRRQGVLPEEHCKTDSRPLLRFRDDLLNRHLRLRRRVKPSRTSSRAIRQTLHWTGKYEVKKEDCQPISQC